MASQKGFNLYNRISHSIYSKLHSQLYLGQIKHTNKLLSKKLNKSLLSKQKSDKNITSILYIDRLML